VRFIISCFHGSGSWRVKAARNRKNQRTARQPEPSGRFFLEWLRRERRWGRWDANEKKPQIKKTRQEWKLFASLVGFMIAGLVMFAGITNIRAGNGSSSNTGVDADAK
jgi:hypothetical protein